MTIPAPLINHATMLVPLGECRVCNSVCMVSPTWCIAGLSRNLRAHDTQYHMITVKSFNTSDGQTYSILIIAETWELRFAPRVAYSDRCKGGNQPPLVGYASHPEELVPEQPHRAHRWQCNMWCNYT